MSGDMDLNPLIRLKDALEGAQKNTAKMLSKLEKFEYRLTDLDDKMRPIQATTNNYTRAKDNISLTLVEVGKTYEYFRVANDVKEVITAGLHVPDPSDFYNALEKLSNARWFFESHKEIKSAVSVLANIESLLNTGIQMCVTEFERLLLTCGKSIEIVDGQYSVLNPVTPATARDIRTVCDAFEVNRYTAHFKVYQSIRTTRLKSELRDLENLHAKDWATALLDSGPYEKGSHPFREYFMLNYNLLRSELQMWGSTLPSNEESLQIFVGICDALIAELERVVAPVLIDDRAVSQHNQNHVIKQSKLLLIRLDILDVYASRYEEFRDLSRPDVRHESSASLSLLRSRNAVVKSAISSMEFLLSSYVAEGFNDKKSSSSSHSHSHGEEAMSCDLHSVTGNIIFCCKEISSFASSYKLALDLSTETNSLSSSIPLDSDDFCLAVLENLFTTLDSRADIFDEKSKLNVVRRPLNTSNHNLFELDDKLAEEFISHSRKHLFMINNLYYLVVSVKDKQHEMSESRVGGAVANVGPASSKTRQQSIKGIGSKLQRISSFIDQIESRLAKEQFQFCEKIACSMGLSNEDMKDFNSSYQQDKSSQQRLLKAKFTIFNTGMDALLAQQGEWRVSATGLRELLRSQIIAKILPVYTEFFNNYSTVKFSKKHMNEYLRFPPAFVERNLKIFFGKSN